MGAQVVHGSRDGDFALLRLGSSELSLLAHRPNPEQDEGTVELNFITEEDLAESRGAVARARGKGRGAGQRRGLRGQLQVVSPDGLLVKVNRLEPDLYT